VVNQQPQQPQHQHINPTNFGPTHEEPSNANATGAQGVFHRLARADDGHSTDPSAELYASPLQGNFVQIKQAKKTW